MVSTTAVVLHVPQAVTFEEYLIRVLVYLLAFAAAGVITFGNLRMIEIVRSAFDQDR